MLIESTPKFNYLAKNFEHVLNEMTMNPSTQYPNNTIQTNNANIYEAEYTSNFNSKRNLDTDDAYFPNNQANYSFGNNQQGNLNYSSNSIECDNSFKNNKNQQYNYKNNNNSNNNNSNFYSKQKYPFNNHSKFYENKNSNKTCQKFQKQAQHNPHRFNQTSYNEEEPNKNIDRQNHSLDNNRPQLSGLRPHMFQEQRMVATDKEDGEID